jgi:hypothetical protein
MNIKMAFEVTKFLRLDVLNELELLPFEYVTPCSFRLLLILRLLIIILNVSIFKGLILRVTIFSI